MWEVGTAADANLVPTPTWCTLHRVEAALLHEQQIKHAPSSKHAQNVRLKTIDELQKGTIVAFINIRYNQITLITCRMRLDPSSSVVSPVS